MTDVGGVVTGLIFGIMFICFGCCLSLLIILAIVGLITLVVYGFYQNYHGTGGSPIEGADGIIEWSPVDVQWWLDELKFESLKEVLKGKNGKEVISMRFKDPAFQTLDPGVKKVFFIYLQHLKQCVRPRQKEDGEQPYRMGFHRVVSKILRGVGMDEFSYKHMQAHASILSSAMKVKKYLLDQKSEGLQRNSLSNEGPQRVRVKLVITESIFRPKEKLLREVVSPILAVIPQFTPKFGMFHSAMLVGPYYLQWTDSEIIIPKNIQSSAAFVSIDTDPLTMDTDGSLEDIKTKIAGLIMKWNSNYTYKQVPRRKNEGNCQSFITELCDVLGISLGLKKDTPFFSFIRELQKKGSYKIEFKCDERFEKEFNIAAYEKREQEEEEEHITRGKNGRMQIEFHTHSQLDRFLFHCLKANAGAVSSGAFRDEYRLLKSFDRAFWLRHLKDKEDERWKPLKKDKSSGRVFGSNAAFACGCPFSDPRATGSYDGM